MNQYEKSLKLEEALKVKPGDRLAFNFDALTGPGDLLTRGFTAARMLGVRSLGRETVAQVCYYKEKWPVNSLEQADNVEFVINGASRPVSYKFFSKLELQPQPF